MSDLIKGIRNISITIFDKVIIRHRRNTEKKKFKDKRRVSIYSKVVLSNDQKKDIDDFYIANYGKKIKHIWHRYYTAYTGSFDVEYFPELLAIPELERFMNPYSEYVRSFSDKNIIAMLATSVGIKAPENVISVVKGFYRDADYNIISIEQAIDRLNEARCVFIKPTVDSSSGNGCSVLEVNDGIDIKTNRSIKEIFELMGKDFVVQKLIKCEDSISKIYNGSVNTFRVITYRWNDKILHCPIIMRIGRGGSHLDNAHAGGMFIAVDEDGTLHKTAFTEFKDAFDKHPDTQVVYEGYKISNFENVLSASHKMHAAIPQLGMINWDFTIDDQGTPVLIEANTWGGSIWMAQMAHGRGIFGENTAELLKYIKKMEKLSPKQREGLFWKS